MGREFCTSIVRDFFPFFLDFENGNKDFDVRIFCNVLILFFCLESRNFENGISK